MERKIKAVAKRLSFNEAEDEYWAKATEEERSGELIELRKIFFEDTDQRIKNVVSKRKRYDEGEC